MERKPPARLTREIYFWLQTFTIGLVAVVPCTGFGAPNFVRWSYATSMDNIRAGLERLEDFLACTVSPK